MAALVRLHQLVVSAPLHTITALPEPAQVILAMRPTGLGPATARMGEPTLLAPSQNQLTAAGAIGAPAANLATEGPSFALVPIRLHPAAEQAAPDLLHSPAIIRLAWYRVPMAPKTIRLVHVRDQDAEAAGTLRA